VRRTSRLVAFLAAALVALLAAACSDGGTTTPAASGVADTTTTTSTTEPQVETLRILLVNDDGMTNPAIDVMLGILAAEPDLDITVVAPAEERSGTSDNLTEGGAAYEPATTPGGARGYAVHGFPGDAVVVGVDELGFDPHLVVSGVNPGQNVGPFAAVSGTVGVGRIAIRRGIPALAVSAGLELDEEQFAFAANLALEWIREHREALTSGSHQTDTLTSINIPACPVAVMGELQEVALAAALPEGVNVFESSCDLSDPAPATDVAAIVAGYPSITQVPAEL
jgi:5'-nucleotidase